MASIVKNSRLIFVDSEINTVSNQAKAKILVPPQPFSVHGGDHMRLTLLSFEMRRNWYSVNQTNCVFYIYTPSTTTYQEIIIPPGSYDTFAKLAAAVQVGLRAAAATYALAECVFDESSRKLTFTLTGAAADAHLVCFQVKQGVRPAGVSDAGFFSDSYELLGLIPSRTATHTNATDAVGPGAHAAPFPCALNTLEAIYLRTNLMGGNYQSYGHERFLPDSNGLVETQILARIPLTRACFDPIFEFVQFEDTNDLFQMHLQRQSLDTIELYVTDDKGRFLAEVDPRQADLGLLSFKCVLRWDHLIAPPPYGYVATVNRLLAPGPNPTL